MRPSDGQRIGDVTPIGDVLAQGEAHNLVKSRCSDCSTVIQIPKWLKDEAVRMHKQLVAAGQPGLSGAGRCEPCGHAWQLEQQRISAKRHALHAEILQSLRRLPAEYAAGVVDARQVRRVIADLPDEFVADNANVVQSLRTALNHIRSQVRQKAQVTSMELE